jgi:hypothetical protein
VGRIEQGAGPIDLARSLQFGEQMLVQSPPQAALDPLGEPTLAGLVRAAEFQRQVFPKLLKF